jgi:hypothetical protein
MGLRQYCSVLEQVCSLQTMDESSSPLETLAKVSAAAVLSAFFPMPLSIAQTRLMLLDDLRLPGN